MNNFLSFWKQQITFFSSSITLLWLIVGWLLLGEFFWQGLLILGLIYLISMSALWLADLANKRYDPKTSWRIIWGIALIMGSSSTCILLYYLLPVLNH